MEITTTTHDNIKVENVELDLTVTVKGIDDNSSEKIKRAVETALQNLSIDCKSS